MSDPADLHCPVCKARFRGQRQCPRCDADLSPLMLVVAQAYQLRHQARRALCQGRYHTAYELASEAQNLHRTSLGQKMVLVARLLDMVRVQR